VVTSGTCVVAGPFETDSVIFVPLDTWLPGGGSELTTTPGARSDWMSTRETTKPWPSSADFAFAYGCPVTSGTGIGLAPRETLMRTCVPFTTLSPGDGNWPVTVSGSAGEKMRTTCGFRPTAASASTASVTLRLRTSGTVTFGLPVETLSVTVEPLPTFEPPPGFSSKTWPLATSSLGASWTLATRPACSI